jgi:hypothetical protein
MYSEYQIVHHFDVTSGSWVYRVFLLPSTLQVDLAFVAASEFRALQPTFRLVHGIANEPKYVQPPKAFDTLGYGWLYALHVRSSIARQMYWKAEYMLSAMRDNALVLACIRHGVTTAHGKGFDKLPREVTEPYKAALVRQLEAGELRRAFSVVMNLYVSEVSFLDSELAKRLLVTLLRMVEVEE